MKTKPKSESRYPEDMDADMIPLCDTLNSLNGIRTFFSCSGHGRGKDEFYISMGVSDVRSLRKILVCFDIYCHKMPSRAKAYRLETDGVFWPLRDDEVNLRISNEWVSGLRRKDRDCEFRRIIKLLKKNKK